MVSFRDRNASLRRPRLRHLQQAQEEIYRQLQLLMPEASARHDSFVSRVDGSPVLRLEFLERHRYTHFLRLTYVFESEQPAQVSPDAHIRAYHDARLAEVTAFNTEQGFQRSAHPWYPALPLARRSWRENIALDKWLSYLLAQGHSFETMRPAKRSIGAASAAEAAVTIE